MIFKISCYSSCGSYFQPYLRSVTVIADDKEEAVNKVKDWCKSKGHKFIHEEKKWDVEILPTEHIIDYDIDSDY